MEDRRMSETGSSVLVDTHFQTDLMWILFFLLVCVCVCLVTLRWLNHLSHYRGALWVTDTWAAYLLACLCVKPTGPMLVCQKNVCLFVCLFSRWCDKSLPKLCWRRKEREEEEEEDRQCLAPPPPSLTYKKEVNSAYSHLHWRMRSLKHLKHHNRRSLVSSLALARGMFRGSSVLSRATWGNLQLTDKWKSACKDALAVLRFSLFLKLPFHRLLIAHKIKNCVWHQLIIILSAFFPTLLRSSLSLTRLLFFFIFHSVWLSFCHFLLLSPGCSLSLSLSLPPSLSSLALFWLLLHIHPLTLPPSLSFSLF